MTILSRLAHYDDPNSLGSRLRRRRSFRIRRLIEATCAEQGECRVLDIGGEARYWGAFDADYLRQHWGIPRSEKTLAKLACIGGGPLYRLFGRIPLYTTAYLDEYAESKISRPVRSTSEYGAD